MSWRRLQTRRADARAPWRGFPRRSPLASWGQHLGIDAREDAVYWARSKRGRTGLRLLEWGRVPLDGEERDDVLSRIARVPWVRFVHVEVPIRSPDLRHKRVSLPPMTPGQALKVGGRRAVEFLGEQAEPCLGSFMRVRQRGAYPLWLVAIPEQAAKLFDERWRALGFDVHRLASESLALGNLARLLPRNADGELSAVVDIQQDAGDCVICDDQGWTFNRVIPIRARAVESAPVGGISNAPHKEGGLTTAQLERIATELERTFRYVDRELRLGRVTRIAVSGERTDLEDVAAYLGEKLGIEARLIGDLVTQGPARGVDPAAVRAVGLAMAPDARGCSLLPRDSKERHRARRARLCLVAGLVGASLLSALLCAAWGLDVHSARRSLARMSAEMGANEERLEIIAETARRRERAAALYDLRRRMQRPEPPWHTYLEVLSRTAPDDLAIEQLDIRREDDQWKTALTVESRGPSVAEAAERVTELRDALRFTPFLGGVAAERDRSRQTVQEDSQARVFFEVAGRLAVLRRERARSSPSTRRGGPDAD